MMGLHVVAVVEAAATAVGSALFGRAERRPHWSGHPPAPPPHSAARPLCAPA